MLRKCCKCKLTLVSVLITCCVFTVGLRSYPVGADDSGSDPLRRHWPFWDVGLSEGWVQNSTTNQLSRWTVRRSHILTHTHDTTFFISWFIHFWENKDFKLPPLTCVSYSVGQSVANIFNTCPKAVKYWSPVNIVRFFYFFWKCWLWGQGTFTLETHYRLT